VADPHTGEVSVKLSYPVGRLTTFTSHTFDFVAYRGAYFGDVGLSYERKLGRSALLMSSVNLGWASSKFNEVYIGVPNRAFNLAGAELSLTYHPTEKIYLRPHVEFSHILDGRLRRGLRRQATAPTIAGVSVLSSSCSGLCHLCHHLTSTTASSFKSGEALLPQTGLTDLAIAPSPSPAGRGLCTVPMMR